jgi:putative aldouronate transport system substrate-binding protein
MRRRVWFAVVISILLVFTAACGKSSTPSGNQTGGGSNAGSSSGASGGSAGSDAEKPVLKWLGFYAANLDPNSDINAQEVEKITGYKVQYSMLPQDKGEEKLNLEIASGSDYDIVSIVAGHWYNLVAQGALLPLDDLLDQYGPNIKNAITPESWETVTNNGKIYGIPYRTERPNIEAAIFYRKDILDDLGLPEPRTVEEFHEVLKKVKAAYPDMIPFTDSGETAYVEGGTMTGGINVPSIYSAFGLYTDWMEINGELVPRILQPGMKDYIAFMAGLFKEGLIDQDLPINKIATKEEKFTSGRAFAMSSTWNDSPRIKPNLLNNIPDAELGYLDPLTDAQGNAGIKALYKLTRVTAIPKNSKHPEDAIKFINTKLEPDNFTYLALGTEGETFVVEDGKYRAINPIFSEKRSNAYWYMNGMDEHRYPDMWLARLHKSDAMIEAFENINENFDKFAVFDPTSMMPPLEAVTKNIAALVQLENEYYIKVLLGDENLDNFDAFLETWKNSGGADMVKAVNEWYASK